MLGPSIQLQSLQAGTVATAYDRERSLPSLPNAIVVCYAGVVPLMHLRSVANRVDKED